jgi:phosphoheptose isomerase
LEVAKQKGCYTAAFLGKDGGTIKNIKDYKDFVGADYYAKDAV